MLKLFRQRKSIIKVLLWGIVLVVGFMMVITLVPGLGGGYGTAIDSPDVVATVGEQVVTAQEVQRQVSWWQNRQGLSNPLLRRFFAEQVIEDLVFQHALEHEAGRLGLEVTPEEVAAQIRRMPELNPGGEFVGAAEYQRLVQQERMTVGEFEERVRSQRLQLKLYHLLTDGLQVSEAEVEQAFRARNEKVAVEYALFKPRTLGDEIHPTAEELRAYFEQNRTRYALPERRRVRYVEVEFAWAAARAPVTPQEIEAHYQRNRESYRVPEQVRFRHILFRFPAVASEEQKEEVRRKAARVRAELARGRDFATLAQQRSEDTATAEQGGDVGWVQRGQVVPALETVLFSLAEGALSEPVEVDYGIHIVRVTGHQQARVKPLEEVRTEIEPMLGQQKNQQEALKLAQQIAQDIRG
ncbi:MAG: peptidylprolyl isomerase, partial [Acidobacteria bacterium]|nr:peptidylprolyl isomerase [Acidobacteriota bacterium]